MIYKILDLGILRSLWV